MAVAFSGGVDVLSGELFGKAAIVTQSILELARRAGDEHFGQTLVRLAQLAAAAEQFDHAAIMTAAFGDDDFDLDGQNEESQSEVKWIRGFDPQSAPASAEHLGDAAYKEVSR